MQRGYFRGHNSCLTALRGKKWVGRAYVLFWIIWVWNGFEHLSEYATYVVVCVKFREQFWNKYEFKGLSLASRWTYIFLVPWLILNTMCYSRKISHLYLRIYEHKNIYTGTYKHKKWLKHHNWSQTPTETDFQLP